MRPVLVLLLLVLIGLTACAGSKDADRSLVTQMPCAPPCWYGLELEESTKIEALDTLRSLSFVDQDRVSFHDYSNHWGHDSGVILYGCKYQYKNDYCGGSIIIRNGKVKSIVYGLGYKLTFGEVVDLYGRPDLIFSESPTTPAGGCRLGLYWESKQLYISNYDHYTYKPCDRLREDGVIDPKLKVDYVNICTEEFIFYDALPSGRLPWSDDYFSNK